MPLWLLLLLGGGAALGAAYLAGRQSSSSFTLADCIERYTKMGYTPQKAMELCEKDYSIYAQSKDYLGKILTYAIPAGIILGGAYWIYKRNQDKFAVVAKKIITENEEKQYGCYSPYPTKR